MPMQMAAEAVIAERSQVDRGKARAWQARRAAARAKGGQGATVQPSDPLQAALVALEPASGPRPRDGRRAEFHDEPLQSRRAGASAAGLGIQAVRLRRRARGRLFTPATMIERLNDPIATVQGAWTPEDEHSSAESMSLRAGLRTSSNRAAVRLLQEVGIASTVAVRQDHGRRRRAERPVAGARFGRGHAPIDDGGVRRASPITGSCPAPMLIRRVEDQRGPLLVRRAASRQPARSPTSPRF